MKVDQLKHLKVSTGDLFLHTNLDVLHLDLSHRGLEIYIAEIVGNSTKGIKCNKNATQIITVIDGEICCRLVALGSNGITSNEVSMRVNDSLVIPKHVCYCLTNNASTTAKIISIVDCKKAKLDQDTFSQNISESAIESELRKYG